MLELVPAFGARSVGHRNTLDAPQTPILIGEPPKAKTPGAEDVPFIMAIECSIFPRAGSQSQSHLHVHARLGLLVGDRGEPRARRELLNQGDQWV